MSQISSIVLYFHAMKINEVRTPAHVIAFITIILFIVARWVVVGYDFSAFFAAGTDFVDASKTPMPVVVQPGQGYDGQFFYRLALNPFDFSPEKYGVQFDFPSYRSQRIVYPLLAWLFSFGGHPRLVPFALVLVNILSFAGTFFFVQRITNKLTGNSMLALYPLVVFGLYMSVAKDLSEVTELMFFTGTIWYLLNASWKSFAIFASLTLLTRETAVVALAPLSLWLFFQMHTNRTLKTFYLLIPFIVLIVWKYYVNVLTNTSLATEGSKNMNFPFTGIYPGFMANFDFSTTKNSIQFLFWVAYFGWQLWFLKIILLTILKNFGAQIELIKPLSVIYVSWLLFAICLSPAIYCDDWSFVRVFSLWNMTGFLILICANNKVGNRFLLFSIGLLFLTIIRLIIRP
jgi:hypothetical protein